MKSSQFFVHAQQMMDFAREQKGTQFAKDFKDILDAMENKFNLTEKTSSNSNVHTKNASKTTIKSDLSTMKKPVNKRGPFSFFRKQHHPVAKEEYPTLKGNDLKKKIAIVWKNMSAEEKQPYKHKATEDVLRYNREMAIWKAETQESKDTAVKEEPKAVVVKEEQKASEA